MFLESCRYDLISAGKCLHNFFYFLVILKIFYGQITCGVFVTYVGIFLYEMLYTVNALLKLRSVIDMDMTGDMRI